MTVIATPSRRQAGTGRLGFIITLALFASGIFAAVKVVPVRIDAYQFREVLREEARYASVHQQDATIRERILDRAGELNIPLNSKNLSIRRTDREVVIRAAYEKPIDLAVTTYVYKFDNEQRAPTF